MKTYSVLKRSLLAATIASCLSIAPSYADVHAAADLLKVQPVQVYHAAHGKSLAETLSQIAQRSGITFKIGIDLSSDTVQQNIAANDWISAVKGLLTDYNYTLVQDGDTLKSVIITGRNHSSTSVVATAPADLTGVASENTIEFTPTHQDLPAKYRDFPAGSVTPVNIPVKQMLDIKDKSVVSMDLPIGNYAVNHDDTVNGENGMQTWVGHLNIEGEGYRVYMSQGPAGVMGVVNTPDGTYHIEQTAGSTYLVDSNKLTSAGFEGDQELTLPTALMEKITASATAAANASTSANGAATAKDSTLTIAQLQAAVTADQAAVAAAQATVTKDQAALAAATSALNNDLTAYFSAASAISTATNNKYATANALANASAAKARALTAENNALNTLNAAKAALNSANTALKNVRYTTAADTSSVNNAQATYNTALANYNATVTAYNTATAAYNAAATAANAANVALNTANQNLMKSITNYYSGLPVLNSAKSALTSATTALATAQSTLNTAIAALTSAQNAAKLTTATTSTTATTANTGPTNIIDIMVYYTTVKQTQAYALQRLQLLTTMSNQAYVDSKINLALRLVHTEPTTYVENNSNNQALSDLTNDSGAFAGTSAKRAQYGADLVYLFRPLYVNATGNCGLTYLEFANASTPSAAIGFGTIGDGNSVDVGGYYCGVNTFTHEIGHSLGLVHDRANAFGYGATPYSYAWSQQGKFATIMSYQTPMLMLFSTPLLTTQCAGQPCGYAANDAKASDQTTVVNMTAPKVAQFMPTTITTPVLQ
ncbi:reprolysin-like metallopeptidase [Methylomonas sp. AM2-LC]|uniref:reprolysin-like metallopeptidase n=1 Tax=Methylomonas sp. AM2-LC TaxID=3153301 RepID=UPI003263133A